MRFSLIFLLLSLIYPLAAYSQSDLTSDNWLEDLEFLVKELEIRHANLFHTISREDFEKEVRILESKIPLLNDEEIVVELERLIARIGDGHTGVFLPFSRSIEFKRLPIRLLRLKDGFVIQATTEKYADLVGEKITQIGNHNISKLIESIYPLLPNDNDFGKQRLLHDYLVLPELLQILDYLDDAESIEITSADNNNNSHSTTLKSVSKAEYSNIQLISADNTLPLWLQNSDRQFWMTYLEEDGILYVQLNSSDIGGLEKEMVDFADKIVEAVNTKAVKKLVLDLRKNRGGSLWRTHPILHALIRADSVNKTGTLFTIISTVTFSAGTGLAALIDQHTDSLFVGEPTGGKPNTYADIGRFNLPHSQVQIRYARLYTGNSDIWDTRPAIYPDLIAELTIQDYREHIDPSLEAIRNYQPRTSLIDILSKTLDEESLEKTIDLYTRLKENNYNQYIFENALNPLGYRLIKEKQFTQAIRVFELNVEEYPWSADAYYSLADAYLAIADKTKAMENLKKAFELNKYYTRWRDLKADKNR